MQDFKDLSAPYPFDLLRAHPDEPIAIDTETLGNTKETNIPFYYSWAAKDFSGAAPITTEGGSAFLIALLASPRPKVFHNAKFDLTVLERVGFQIQGEIHDTIIMHALLDPYHEKFHRLKELSRELLGRQRDEQYELQQLGFGKKDFYNSDLPQDILHKYAKADAEDTFTLFELFAPKIKHRGQWELYRWDIQAILAYKKIQQKGILLNLEELDPTYNQIQVVLDELAQTIYKMAGCEFKLSASSPECGKVLAPILNLTEKTPAGRWKLDKDVLGRYLHLPLVQFLMAWRYLNKAGSMLKGYRKYVEKDGRIHPQYSILTVTGRSSCSKPNIQQIPKQQGKLTEVEVGTKELAQRCSQAFRTVRRIFVVPDDFLLVCLDYSQVEYKCFAFYSKSERLLSRIRAGEDFHKVACQLVFGRYDERLRHIQKILAYGILYGMGNELLNTQLTRAGFHEEGILQKYEKELPEMRTTQQRIREVSELRGYVQDVFKRRYPFVKERPHAMVAYLCQGTTANIKKRALSRVSTFLDTHGTTRSQLIGEIHDELIIELHREDLPLLADIKKLMEDFPEFEGVPITTDIAIGKNLLEVQEFKTIPEAITFARTLI